MGVHFYPLAAVRAPEFVFKDRFEAVFAYYVAEAIGVGFFFFEFGVFFVVYLSDVTYEVGRGLAEDVISFGAYLYHHARQFVFARLYAGHIFPRDVFLEAYGVVGAAQFGFFNLRLDFVFVYAGEFFKQRFGLIPVLHVFGHHREIEPGP